MKYIKKYEILQALESEVGNGVIFPIIDPTKDYGVSFIEDGFKFNRDYKVCQAVLIDRDGVEPKAGVFFTYKGVKRLLKRSIKARTRIDDLWREWIREEV